MSKPLKTGTEIASTPSSAGMPRRIARRPVVAGTAAFLLVLIALAAAAPLIAPHDPLEQNYAELLLGPSADHWLGTDELGRDTLSRLLYGARVSLLVAFGSVAIAMAIGVPLGLLLGYFGGWWDRLGSRAIDVSEALPGILLGFAVIAILGRGLGTLMLAIGLMFCMTFARTTRAVALAEREKVYLDAARVAGLRTPEIMFRQVLPNLAGPLIVQAAMFMGAAAVVESALSFLGLGLETGVPSWGGMLSVAADEQGRQPFLAFPPGLAIIVTVFAFNVLSDGINDGLAGGRRKPAARRRTERRPANDLAVKAPTDPGTVLAVQGVTVELDGTTGGPVPLVEDVWLSIGSAEVVGLVGESGSGKSMLARAVLNLLPPAARLASGSVLLDGRNIAGLPERDLRKVRGCGISVVFQDPMTALSPVHTVGRQLCEPLRVHFGMSRQAARERAAELLERVGVENPKRRLDDYPHQFSGGMAQRVAIAMALAAKPRLLIADEATSALDVTTQGQVLDLLLGLRDELDMAILMITHDLGVVAESCDRAAVMYAGQIVEVGGVRELFDGPRHPYTAALLASDPSAEAEMHRLQTIPGGVPLAGEWPPGCHFANRCAFAREECVKQPVPITGDVRCLRAKDLTLEVMIGERH